MSAAAVIAIRRKRLIRRFREAGATDPEHAITLESVGDRRSWVFDQMVRHRVFLPAAGGNYYLDERAAAEFLHARRVRALAIAAALLALFVVLWLSGFLRR